MPDAELIELSRLQRDRAREILDEIPLLLGHGSYNTAVNRSYYTAFHMLKALEILDRFDSKKHAGVISFFRANYVKTGVFPEEMSEIIGSLQDAREDSDYNVIVHFDEELATGHYQKARQFFDTIDRHLQSRYVSQ